MHKIFREPRWAFLVIFTLVSAAACNAPEEKTSLSTATSVPLQLNEAAPLKLYVSEAPPAMGLDARLLRPEGGIPPYQFTVLDGPGRIENSLFSSEIAGTTTIRLTDSVGHIADAIVVTKGAVLLQASRKNVAAGSSTQNRVTLSYSGGEGQLSLSVTSGPGQLFEDTFVPPEILAEDAKTVITVADAQGRRAQVEIAIAKTISLQLSKTVLTRGYSEQNHSDLLVEGGVPPYTYALSSNLGSLQSVVVDGKAVKRFLPDPEQSVEPAAVDVVVTDSLGNQVLKSLTVNPSVRLWMGATTTTAAGTSSSYRITFEPAGGTPPLSVSLGNPSVGSIVESHFVPPAQLQTTVQQTLLVQDANGVVVSRGIVISPNFTVLADQTSCYAGKTHALRNVKYTLAAGTLPYASVGSPAIGTLTQSDPSSFVFTPPAVLSQDTPVTVSFRDGGGTQVDSALNVSKSISFEPVIESIYEGAAPYNEVAVSASGGQPSLSWSWREEGASLWQTSNFSNGKFVPYFPTIVTSSNRYLELRATDALGDERIQFLTVRPGVSPKTSFTYFTASSSNNQTVGAAAGRDGYFYATRVAGSKPTYCIEVFRNAGRTGFPIKTVCPTTMSVMKVASRLDSDYVYFAGEVGTTTNVDIKIGRMKIGGSVDTFEVTLATSATDRISALEMDSLGNLYVSGYTFGAFAGTGSTAAVSGFLAKLDATGKLLWVKQDFGVTNCIRLVASGDSVYGLCRPDGELSKIYRFDTNGKFLVKTESFNRLSDLAVDSADGRVYFVDSRYWSDNRYKATLYCYDSNLLPQWSETFGSTDTYGSVTGMGVRVTSDRIYLGLSVYGEFAGIPGTMNEVALMRLDKGGNPLWARKTGIAERGSEPQEMVLMPTAGADDVYFFGRNFYSNDVLLTLYGFTILD